MKTSSRPRSTRDRPAKAPLSEEAIVDAALAILRAEGLAAVSMRRVAAALDGRQAGAGYVAALIDLGRPPVSSLIEPDRELAAVSADLSALRTRQE